MGGGMGYIGLSLSEDSEFFAKNCVSVKHRNTETQSFVSIKFLCFYSLYINTVNFLQKTVFQ